jgi:nucleoside phosphorylase
VPQHHQFRRGRRTCTAFAYGQLDRRIINRRRAAHASDRSRLVEHRPIAGVDYAVATTEAKRRMHAETGAAAVDMESHIVARLAAAHGLNFAAVRVVIDPAHRAVPGAALAGMRPDGGTSITAVLRELIASPSQLTGLLRLAYDGYAARRALLRTRRLLGPGFGLLGLGEA